MTIVFYPNEDNLVGLVSIQEKLEVLLEAAERYKSAILDASAKALENPDLAKTVQSPRDITLAYQWQEIATLLRKIRELPENNPPSCDQKIESLTKLAEIYEVLRGAKMPKLEAVRLALLNEASQLKSIKR